MTRLRDFAIALLSALAFILAFWIVKGVWEVMR